MILASSGMLLPNARGIVVRGHHCDCFDCHKGTELFVDASKFSIGAVLQQVDDRGESHPVGYYSRRLNQAEQNYATYDKELLGLRDGVLHFRHHVWEIKFKVHTIRNNNYGKSL